MAHYEEEKYLRTECQGCGNFIEFPDHGLGKQIQCPHCGADVKLTGPENPKKPNHRSAWVVALAVGAIGLLVGNGLARYDAGQPADGAREENNERLKEIRAQLVEAKRELLAWKNESS